MDKFLKLVLVTAVCFLSKQQSFGQSWMDNYSYRKKITIDKNKVTPITTRFQSQNIYNDLTDFPVLIELMDPDLIHVPGNCGNKIRDTAGRDIAIALSTAAASPIDYQLEHYDAATGKLRLWIRIPSLSANMSASAPTSFYLYYGSSVLHDPEGLSAKNTWSDDNYSRVWHMNIDDLPCIGKDAKTQASENRLIGSYGMGLNNLSQALLGYGMQFDGASQYMTAGKEISTAVTVSAWIKLTATGQDQVIISNDTSGIFGTNGYTLKVNSDENLVFETRMTTSAPFNRIGYIKLQKDNWYYVCATSTGKDINLFVNGMPDYSRAGSVQKLGAGGTVRVGADKSGSFPFGGIIDELRIHKLAKTLPWFKTEYENQRNPAGFYTVSNEEYNPAVYSKFTGAVNSSWATAGNWQDGLAPLPNSNIVIATGKTLRIEATQEIHCNNLTLENGALLSLGGKLTANCTLKIDPLARIILDNEAVLNCSGDIINNGSIALNEHYGSLIFSGRQSVQHFRGTGSTTIYRLEHTQSMANHMLSLNSSILVSGEVQLNRGIFNSNGHLKLLANPSGAASLLPILNTDSAAMTGIVHVQKYIDGDYPSPATARGWKLLASPVYHSGNQGNRAYTIAALQNSMFITGKGGAGNGFDPSPLNSATVYTHDQSLSGKLSQKYVPIPNTFTSIPFGKGLCVFSRGDRTAANAYLEQVQSPPFSNPGAYTLTHSGFVHTGNLAVPLTNKNEGKDGDGFNLIGNPYPSPVTWGNLNKVNLADFIWLFDPLNNAYTVSDLPETLIPSGSGFFVKVKNGFANGILTFTEASKHLHDVSNPLPSLALVKTSAINLPSATPETVTLAIELSKGVFKQLCKVKFSVNGNDGIDDHDALKIDEGYVSIGSLVNGQNLSVNERSLDGPSQEVQLNVKGWEAGKYQLTISGMEKFKTTVFLFDKYLNRKVKVTGKHYLHEFVIDPAVEATYGNERFSLQLQDHEPDVLASQELMVYPNPFKDKLFLNSAIATEFTVTLRDLFGRMIIQRKIQSGENILSETGKTKLEKGIYLLQVSDALTTRHFKILKE